MNLQWDGLQLSIQGSHFLNGAPEIPFRAVVQRHQKQEYNVDHDNKQQSPESDQIAVNVSVREKVIGEVLAGFGGDGTLGRYGLACDVDVGRGSVVRNIAKV